MSRLVITGGTGQLGSALLESEVVHQTFKQIAVVSRTNACQSRLASTHPNVEFLKYPINSSEVSSVFKSGDFVIHAGASKSVSTAETDPLGTITNNVNAALKMFIHAKESRVAKVIFVSSVKACNPNSVYGASKILIEKACSALSNDSKETHFSSVRLASLLETPDNLLKIWKNRTLRGYPLFLSHEKMTRFFMRKRDASSLILHALLNSFNGDTLVPKLSSFVLFDLAKHISKIQDIRINGLGPGEKIHDDLLSVEEFIQAEERNDYFIIKASSKKERIGSNDTSLGISSDLNVAYSSRLNSKVFHPGGLFKISAEQMRDYLDNAI